MGMVKVVGGDDILKITPEPRLDLKTEEMLEGIPATVLMEVIRKRLQKYPENKELSKDIVGMQLKV